MAQICHLKLAKSFELRPGANVGPGVIQGPDLLSVNARSKFSVYLAPFIETNEIKTVVLIFRQSGLRSTK